MMDGWRDGAPTAFTALLALLFLVGMRRSLGTETETETGRYSEDWMLLYCTALHCLPS
jgi:hypothetical protein